VRWAAINKTEDLANEANHILPSMTPIQKFAGFLAVTATATFTGCTTVHQVEVVHTRPVTHHHTYYHETHTSTASSAPSPQDFTVVSQYDRQSR